MDIWGTAWWATAVAAVLGAALLIRGWRGRRVGTDPHCRKCGYNLTGITSERCPECGTPHLDNPVLGQFRRRYRLVLAGLLILLPSTGMLIRVEIQWARSVEDWYRYKPTFLVLRDAKAAYDLATPPAFWEASSNTPPQSRPLRAM